jgi:threonine synthase
MANIRCTNCGQPYPEKGLPFRCLHCGGLFDYDDAPDFDPGKIEKGLPGYWRYRHTFSLFPGAPDISLGEGNTPLIWDSFQGRQVGFKLESLNPTASYKDRGSAVLVSQLLSRGATSAVEDSSGNAGASFAAYAARARLKARVFVPESASGPKRSQIEHYGADLVQVPGPRSEAAKAVLREAGAGSVYASHAFMPFGLPGIATIAYELWEEMGEIPGTVIAPVGHGGLLLGIMRGFSALYRCRFQSKEPYYVGVQAKACAPVVAAYAAGFEAMQTCEEGVTRAEGVRVRQPSRVVSLIRQAELGKAEFIAIAEEEILPAYEDLARRGIYVEPTSALVWCALAKLVHRLPEPIVLILSGYGLKAQVS